MCWKPGCSAPPDLARNAGRAPPEAGGDSSHAGGSPRGLLISPGPFLLPSRWLLPFRVLKLSREDVPGSSEAEKVSGRCRAERWLDTSYHLPAPSASETPDLGSGREAGPLPRKRCAPSPWGDPIPAPGGGRCPFDSEQQFCHPRGVFNLGVTCDDSVLTNQG